MQMSSLRDCDPICVSSMDFNWIWNNQSQAYKHVIFVFRVLDYSNIDLSIPAILEKALFLYHAFS